MEKSLKKEYDKSEESEEEEEKTYPFSLKGYDIYYRIVSQIGRGGFGKVYMIEFDPKNDKIISPFPIHEDYYAMKVVKNNSQDADFEKESIEILNQLYNKGCNKYLLCYYYIEKDLSKNQTIFISDLYDGNLKLLSEELRQDYKDELISENQFLKIFHKLFMTLILGLKKLHETNIIHQDLKPENILFKRYSYRDDNQDFEFIISDFGLSCAIDLDYTCEDCRKCNHMSGSIGYLDPLAVSVIQENKSFENIKNKNSYFIRTEDKKIRSLVTYQRDYYAAGMVLIKFFIDVSGTDQEQKELKKIMNKMLPDKQDFIKVFEMIQIILKKIDKSKMSQDLKTKYSSFFSRFVFERINSSQDEENRYDILQKEYKETKKKARKINIEKGNASSESEDSD